MYTLELSRSSPEGRFSDPFLIRKPRLFFAKGVELKENKGVKCQWVKCWDRFLSFMARLTRLYIWHAYTYDTPNIWITYTYDTPIQLTHLYIWHTYTYNTPNIWDTYTYHTKCMTHLYIWNTIHMAHLYIWHVYTYGSYTYKLSFLHMAPRLSYTCDTYTYIFHGTFVYIHTYTYITPIHTYTYDTNTYIFIGLFSDVVCI